MLTNVNSPFPVKDAHIPTRWVTFLTWLGGPLCSTVRPLQKLRVPLQPNPLLFRKFKRHPRNRALRDIFGVILVPGVLPYNIPAMCSRCLLFPQIRSRKRNKKNKTRQRDYHLVETVQVLKQQHHGGRKERTRMAHEQGPPDLH